MIKKYMLSLLILLVFLSISIVGCGNKKDIEPEKSSNRTNDIKEDSVVKTENNDVNRNSDISNSKGSNDITYQLTENVYTNKNVIINYPQIINLDNKDKQNTINELIRNEALADFSNGVDKNLDLKLDYEIKLKSTDVLSIKYSGVGYYKGASHPNNWFFTTNIDMKSGKKKLSDLIKIDENFVRAFKKGKYITQSSKELQQAVTEYVNDIDSTDLMKYFNQSDSRSIEENPTSVFSYITKESIVISISVLHAIGDHAEYQIDYCDIQGNFKNNELWDKLINP